MFRALAQFALRRPWPIIVVAIIFFAVSGVAGGPVAALLQGGGFDDPSSGSVAARNQLQQATRINQDENLIALVRTGQPVQSPATRSEVERVAAAMHQDPAVAQVLTVYNTHDRSMIGKDGTSTYIVTQFKAGPNSTAEDAAARLKDRLKSDPHVLLGGGAIASQEIGTTVTQDLGRAELIAFPILFVLLLFLFRGFVAALFPLLMGAFTIMGAFLGLRLVNEAVWMSVYALDLIIGLGLGLSIDYSLLIISRYREEIAQSGPGPEAVRRTMNSAGRTVFFSSFTVSAALASLLVFPQRFLVSMGVGGILAAVLAATAALVLLPAVLGLLGVRINSLAPRRWQQTASGPAQTGFWYRQSHFVMRHAAPIAGATALLLIVLGLPFLRIKFNTIDPSVLPKSTATRQVYDALHTDFPPNRTSPISIVLQAPVDGSTAGSLQRYAAGLRGLTGVDEVAPPRPQGSHTWLIDITSRTSVFSDQSQTLVRDIRSRPAPYAEVVGGDTATFVDLKSSLAAHLPIALLIIAIVTYIVLFLVTGSLVLPLKSLLMNLLSLSATFGLLVLIFQDGRLQGLLNYTSQGSLEATQPVLLFALAFGLATDYSVFLLSRIKEFLDGGASNNEAVAAGIERTGRIITAAALLFSVAIGAFVTSEMVFIKELGLGTALAVLIDATLVRALLVPSLMALLGRWNWWAPRPLARFQRRFRLEGPVPDAP